MAAAEEYKARIESLNYRNQAFINGAFVDAASGKTFENISPIDGKVLTNVAYCDAEDVDRAVAAARAAFESGVWSRMAPAARKKTMLRFADLVEQNASELALLETLDVGKPIGFVNKVDIPGVVTAVRYYGEAIDKMFGEIAPQPSDLLVLVKSEPIGVIAAVTPFNFPMLMASWKFAPALAAGNSVILKPAEQTPLTALRLAELGAEAGIPDGVFQVIPGFGETAGQALGMHMDVDMVTFTGSGEVGKLFLQYSGRSNMKQISLECGGKGPNIIFADAPDVTLAAKQAAMAIFFNSGQVCHAGSRLLVEETIHDQVMEILQQASAPMQPGDPFDPKTRMGAVIDETQMNKVMDYIGIGQKEGADLIFGGQRVRTETGGFYVEPTIFDSAKNDMRIAQEEIFGPVLATISFKTQEEAVAIANDTTYGLLASLWTSDINKAHTMADQLQNGTVTVNTIHGADITAPFGGYKQSGIGRDKSLHAYEKYTQFKTVNIQLPRS